MTALNGVTLRLKPGEVHALLGDNGAGKSTLIKTLAGVHAPDTGRYLVEGRECDFAHPRPRSTPASPRSIKTWRWCR